MFIIKNGKNTVSGVNFGVLSYAHDDRKPLLFETHAAACAWWSENAPTLPPIDEPNYPEIRTVEVTTEAMTDGR